MRTLQRFAPPTLSGNGSGATPTTNRTPRRVPPTAVGVLVGALAFGVFVVLTPAGSRSSPVLVVAHPVPAGHRISASDLRVVSLRVPAGLAVVRAVDEGSVVGQVAKSDLSAGSLLAGDEVGSSSGSATEVGLALKPGQYPPGLVPGDRVEVLAGPAAGDSTAPTASGGGLVLAPVGVVQSVSPAAADPNTVMVGLQVAAGEAVTVAEAGAAGRVVLVVQR